MSKQYLSVPVQYDNSDQLQADDIKIPVSILVMHDKINLNQSNFDFDVIDADITKESIKNIPILGYIRKVDGSDSKDFAGHEMEVVFKDGDIKIIYLERPIGVIPETNHYEYVEKDGKKYVKVIGYLWKDYLNDGYEILQENPNKSVSMEIVVDGYEVKKDGIIDIKAYRYTGITVLGDTVSPAMKGANMEVIGQFSDNQRFSQEFYERIEKLNYELTNKKYKIDSYFIPPDKAEKLVQKANSIFNQLGFECLEYIVDGKEHQITGIINKTLNKEASENWGFDIYDKDTITIYSLDFETIDTASISISSVELLMNKNINTNQQHFTLKIKNNFAQGGESENMNKKEDKSLDNIDLSFSATYRQKREALQNALDPIIKKDENDKVIYEEYRWVEDFDDKYVFVERSIWTDSNYERLYGRYTYTFDEATITTTITSEFEKMFLVWLTEAENQKLQEDRAGAEKINAEFEALKTKSAEFEVTINTLTEENTTLKTTNEDLVTYKNKNKKELHETAISEVFAEFDESLKENQEYTELKEKVNTDVMNYNVENLEKELFAMVGKVNFSKAGKKVKTEKVSASVIEGTGTEVVGSRYGKYEKFIEKKD